MRSKIALPAINYPIFVSKSWIKTSLSVKSLTVIQRRLIAEPKSKMLECTTKISILHYSMMLEDEANCRDGYDDRQNSVSCGIISTPSFSFYLSSFPIWFTWVNCEADFVPLSGISLSPTAFLIRVFLVPPCKLVFIPQHSIPHIHLHLLSWDEAKMRDEREKESSSSPKYSRDVCKKKWVTCTRVTITKRHQVALLVDGEIFLH